MNLSKKTGCTLLAKPSLAWISSAQSHGSPSTEVDLSINMKGCVGIGRNML